VFCFLIVILIDKQAERLGSKLSISWALCSLSLFLLACGCAKDKEFERPPYAGIGAFAPMPPAFLTGPAAALLTNVDGFSVYALFMSDSLPSPSKPLSGELLGREGKLLFAPEPREAKKISRGGFTFLWDVSAGRGYLLSEALQAFAPLSASVRPTNLVTQPDSTTLAKIDGHACQVEQKLTQMSDGSSALFRVWRALDLKQFPIRIDAATNAGSFSLQCSKVRLQAPPAELFTPPSGFTQYPNAEAMMTELVIRQHNLRRGAGGATEQVYPLRDRR